jgi:hypothetical protein
MRNPELALLGVRLSAVAVIAFCVRALAPQPAAADDPPVTDQPSSSESAARKKLRVDNLKAMAERAGRARIRVAGNNGKEDETTDCRLIPQPLFHYTDQPRRIIDATLWGWTVEGRLLAICKIENYEAGAHPEGEWLYCCGSLATGLVEAEFPDGHRWSARKPGIELREFAGAPPAGDGTAARLRQMKEIGGRFSATIVNATSGNSQEMRLLPRPIYRYENGTSELPDGTVFGLTTNGTNPDAILVVELHRPAEAAPKWKFGVAGMTQEQLSVKFDGKEVWSKPHSPASGKFDTWMFFWENEK